MRYVKVSKNEQLTMLIKKKINYLVNEKLQTNAKKIQNNQIVIQRCEILKLKVGRLKTCWVLKTYWKRECQRFQRQLLIQQQFHVKTQIIHQRIKGKSNMNFRRRVTMIFFHKNSKSLVSYRIKILQQSDTKKAL